MFIRVSSSVTRYIQQQETKSESKNHSLHATTIQTSLERSRKHYSTCIACQFSISETFILLHSSLYEPSIAPQYYTMKDGS
jgi:hypothetical protein